MAEYGPACRQAKIFEVEAENSPLFREAIRLGARRARWKRKRMDAMMSGIGWRSYPHGDAFDFADEVWTGAPARRADAGDGFED